MAFKDIKNLTSRAVMAEMLYQMERQGPANWYAPFTFRAESNQPDGETHAWLGGFPGMTERKGDPQFGGLIAPEFFIKNVPFQAGVSIKKEHWLFQKLGLIEKRINEGVEVALDHPGLLIQQAIAAAESTNCYDGQFFFDTDHSEGSSGTQNNDITLAKAGTLPTASEMQAAILKAIGQMLGFKDDKGNQVNMQARSFTVCAPTSLMGPLIQAIDQVLIGGGDSNVLAQGKRFTLIPQLLPSWSGNKIAVFRNREPLMGSAFIHQILLNPEPVILDVNSEYCRLKGEILFKIEGTYNVGYGRWQDSCLVTFTGP